MTVTIAVRGIPAPQGNHRVNPSGATYETSKAVGPWREAVRAETQRRLGALGHAALPAPGTPTVVEIEFDMPRPASAPKRQTHPVKRPDLDKLARAVLDGLVAGGALADDSQVTCLRLRKAYAVYPATPGALISITIDREGT